MSDRNRWDDSGVWRMIRYFAPLIIGLVGLATAWGIFSERVQATDIRVTKVEGTVAENCQRIAKVEQVVTEMPEIKRDIKELLRRTK